MQTRLCSNAKIADTQNRNEIMDRQTWQSEADNAALLLMSFLDVALGNTFLETLRSYPGGMDQGNTGKERLAFWSIAGAKRKLEEVPWGAVAGAAAGLAGG